jgi:hypothetical protein
VAEISAWERYTISSVHLSKHLCKSKYFNVEVVGIYDIYSYIWQVPILFFFEKSFV